MPALAPNPNGPGGNSPAWAAASHAPKPFERLIIVMGLHMNQITPLLEAVILHTRAIRGADSYSELKHCSRLHTFLKQEQQQQQHRLPQVQLQQQHGLGHSTHLQHWMLQWQRP